MNVVSIQSLTLFSPGVGPALIMLDTINYQTPEFFRTTPSEPFEVTGTKAVITDMLKYVPGDRPTITEVENYLSYVEETRSKYIIFLCILLQSFVLLSRHHTTLKNEMCIILRETESSKMACSITEICCFLGPQTCIIILVNNSR